MGFTTLNDVIPGAFAAAMLECFFPRGLAEFGTPQGGDIGSGLSSPVCNRQCALLVATGKKREHSTNCNTYRKALPPKRTDSHL